MARFDAILHHFATRMLGGEADTRLMQHLVGHADWSTSQICAQVSIRQWKRVHPATHPAKLKGNGRPSKTERGAWHVKNEVRGHTGTG